MRTALRRTLCAPCAHVFGRSGGPRSVVAPHPLPTDATAARPSINTIWLRPYAALVPGRNWTFAKPIGSSRAPAVASHSGGGSRGRLIAPTVCPPYCCCAILHTQIILLGGDCQGGWYSQKMGLVDSTAGAIGAQCTSASPLAARLGCRGHKSQPVTALPARDRQRLSGAATCLGSATCGRCIEVSPSADDRG